MFDFFEQIEEIQYFLLSLMFRHKLFKNLYDTYLRLIGNVVTAVCQTKLYEKEIVSLSVLVLSSSNYMQLPRNIL